METGGRFIVPSDGLEKPGIEPTTPTVCTPSSRNCIFQKLTFLKDLKKYITTPPLSIPKVLKSATKILKIG